MIIELWTWKFAGKNKGHFTYWRTIYSDHIPVIGRTFIYTTKKGNSTDFNINHIEYEYKFNRLKIQLCITRIKK